MIDLDGFIRMVRSYDDKALQEEALKKVPLNDIIDGTRKKFRDLQKGMKESKRELCESQAYEYLFLTELVTWYKNDFFKWMDSPICSECEVPSKFHKTKAGHGGDSVGFVEVFKCPKCSKILEFPRYNNAQILLETRIGRCGEWAQCFTLICRALGYRARYVYDVTEHVWTEIYSNFAKRWIHCDPCEAVIDTPLMYEMGWGKNLSYIFAIENVDIQDVTWRYSCNHAAVRKRRSLRLDRKALDLIMTKRKSLQANLTPAHLKHLNETLISELWELMMEPKPDGTYVGRTSGSLEWRAARRELGSAESESCNKFIWTPTEAEICQKKMVIKYSATKDCYSQESSDGEKFIKGWQNGTFEAKNVVRKEEFDWKFVYLSRREGSESGCIRWNFDVSKSGMTVHSVDVKCEIFLIETGKVRMELFGDKGQKAVLENVGYFEVQCLAGSKVFSLEVQFCGGEGSVAWQHSQLCRSPFGDKDYPLQITINLKE